MFTFKERKELNELSKEIFGRTSFWYNHIYKKGINVKLESDKTKKEHKWLKTFDEIKSHLLEVKDNTAKILADMKKSTETNVDQ